MATTKKTENKDDVKKTAAKKPAAKKKTTAKKEVESTGVVDEFLNNAIGETITKEEAEKQPEPKKKKTSAKKKTETVEKKKKTTTKKNDVKQNDEIVTDPGLTINEEKEKSCDEMYKEIEELNERLDILGLGNVYMLDSNEDVQEDAMESAESIKQEESGKTPEEKWNDLGLTSEMQEEIKEVVKEIDNKEVNKLNNPDDVRNEKYANEVNTLVKKWDDTDIVVDNNEKGEIAKVPVEKQNRFYNPRHDVYPPITEVNKKTEEKKPEEKSVMTYTTTKETSAPVTVESLRVKFEDQKTENNFTFVTTSMGVRYD